MKSRCSVCRGDRIVRGRLSDPRCDDGAEHFLRCPACKGTGLVSAFRAVRAALFRPKAAVVA